MHGEACSIGREARPGFSLYLLFIIYDEEVYHECAICIRAGER